MVQIRYNVSNLQQESNYIKCVIIAFYTMEDEYEQFKICIYVAALEALGCQENQCFCSFSETILLGQSN